MADEKDVAGSADHLWRTLSRFAYRLFPHDTVPTEVYDEVAASLTGRASDDAALAELLETGVRRLDEAGAVAWVDRDEAGQIAGMAQIQDGEFFSYLRRTSIEHLYRNQRVWDLLGFEGSSVEHGGYLDRGFDDIDWLPTGDDDG